MALIFNTGDKVELIKGYDMLNKVGIIGKVVALSENGKEYLVYFAGSNIKCLHDGRSVKDIHGKRLSFDTCEYYYITGDCLAPLPNSGYFDIPI